jgi:AbrB family transcriptional regulator (stage V sporulation protein T)
MAHTVVVVGERGRMVLPSAVRRKLGLAAGTRLLLDVESDGSLRLQPFRDVAERCLGMLSELSPYEGSAVDDLLAERRAEVAAEERG